MVPLTAMGAGGVTVSGRGGGGAWPRARRKPASGRGIGRLGAGGLVLGLAVLARLLVLLDVRDAPFWTTPLMDERLHLHLANLIRAGGGPPLGAWYVSPGYPYLLAGLLAAGGGILQVKLLQLAVGVLNSWLIYRLGRRWFGVGAGVVAGCLWAVLPSALLHEVLVLNATVTVLCLLVALVLIAPGGGEGAPALRAWRWAAAGLALGAAAVLRGEMLLAAGLVVAAAVVGWRRRWPGAPRSALGPALLAAGLAAVVAVPTLQNARAGGGLVVVAYGGGPNFYIGNNPEADGSYLPLRPDRMDVSFEERDAVDLAREGAGRDLTPAGVSRWWLGRGLRWWLDDTPAALLLTAKKALLAWGWWEGADVITPAVAGRWVRPLRLPLRSGLVLAPALMGLWLARRRRDLWPLWAVLGGLQLALTFFFVFERFRLPLIAVSLPLAGLAVTTAVNLWRAGRRERALLGVVAVCVLGGLLAVPGVAREKAGLRANVGTLLLEQGRYREALREFEAVRDAAPWEGRINISLATAHAALGRKREAIQDLGHALQFLYGEADRTGRVSTEEALYCHELAGDLMVELGNPDGARANWEAALKLPGVEEAARRRLEQKVAASRP